MPNSSGWIRRNSFKVSKSKICIVPLELPHARVNPSVEDARVFALKATTLACTVSSAVLKNYEDAIVTRGPLVVWNLGAQLYSKVHEVDTPGRRLDWLPNEPVALP